MKRVVMSVILAGSLFAMPTAFDAALGDQTLREGTRHGDVSELQDALRDTGHFTYHTSTGYFGSITNQAVRNFQRSNGLSVDGIAGPQTFNALGVSSGGSSATQVSNSSGSTISFNTVLRSGSRGDQVRQLQRALSDRGYNSGSNVDGVFGPKTAQSVRDFQRSAGISVDGIAGPQTYSAINGNSSSSGSSSNSGSTASSGSSSSSNSSSNTATHVSNSTGGATSAMLTTARSVIGTPYQWGGTTTAGFDCSGFINYVYNQHGKSIPRTVAQMWATVTKVSNPQAGDIVFFAPSGGGPSHNGIYLGGGQFIHSGSSTGVTISNMNSGYWSNSYVGAGSL
ncbi:peptidoglycan-binding protein [Salipaludibacillus sp. HK11]|uniref:C40 family peptidase n=1 Tax=Salipaludibacillus sp. HK11 TaxID=3394320 RepID=UPI0039FD2CB2